MPTNQQQAERRELERQACAHLTLDELRGGVVSRKVAMELAVGCSKAIGALGIIEVCSDFNRKNIPTLIDGLRRRIDACRTATSKGSDE